MASVACRLGQTLTATTQRRDSVRCFTSVRPDAAVLIDHQASLQGALNPDTIQTRRSILQRIALAAAVVVADFNTNHGDVVMWRPASAAAASGPRMPTAEEQKALDAALSKVIVKPKAAVALRLVFHDAGTFSKQPGDGGANASIRFELDRPENFGLKRGWRLILELEKAIQGTPAQGTVSYADLIALAGAKAVAVCGGPLIPVPIGRVDAQAADPPNRMPAETLTAEELKTNFAAKGLSVREMVTLSGAHTVGGKGFGDPVTFDTAYFRELLKKPWADPNNAMGTHIGLPSDHVLPDDPECVPIIQEFAGDQDKFFSEFSTAYVKMTSLGATWA